MRTRYLLPCSCGRNLQVDISQSGLQVDCVCGAKLEVPAMRGLAMLEHVPEQSTGAMDAAPVWGPRQGLMLLGGTILAIGLGLVSFFAARAPAEPSADPSELADIPAQVATISPSQILEVWDKQFRGGIGIPLTMTHEIYMNQVAEQRMRLILSGIVCAVGLAVLGLGTLYQREESTRGVNSRQPSAAGPSP